MEVRRADRLRLLARPSDLGCVTFHVATLLAYAVAFAVHSNANALGVDTPLQLAAFELAAALALGWCSGVEVGVAFHNHAHRRIFTRPAWNRWFERTWTVSGGWPAYLWKFAHVHVHHRRLGHAADWTLPRRDADGRVEGIWRYSLLHWPWRYVPALVRELRAPGTSPGVRRRAWRETAWFALAFALPCVFLEPRAALTLWVAPAWLANALVMGPGMYAQHAGCVARADEGSLAHSNTFRSGLFNTVMFNIGFHAEHHTHPEVHWSDLPALHQDLADDLRRDGVHVVPFGYYRAGYLLSRAALGSARCREEWLAGDPSFKA